MPEATDWAATRAAGAAVFAQTDVVASYYARQPYAPDAYAWILAKTPGRQRALDLGCGPGPVARELAPHFAEVVALDPSVGMIAAGQAASHGAPNIRWLCSPAESYEADARFDLVVAGSSIHFVDPPVVFPKLARWSDRLATLANDPWFPYPPPPCGLEAWVEFLARWNAHVGRQTPAWWRNLEDRPPPRPMPWDPWMDVLGREEFRFIFRQSVADFVASCHARLSWPRQMMGEALAAEFDAALSALLEPHAIGGLLALDIITELSWGAPRSNPRR